MRRDAIAEAGGSLLIAVLTGIYTVVGFSGYYILGFHPSTKTFGIILLLVGIASLPICVMWSFQLAREITPRVPPELPREEDEPSPPLKADE